MSCLWKMGKKKYSEVFGTKKNTAESSKLFIKRVKHADMFAGTRVALFHVEKFSGLGHFTRKQVMNKINELWQEKGFNRISCPNKTLNYLLIKKILFHTVHVVFGIWWIQLLNKTHKINKKDHKDVHDPERASEILFHTSLFQPRYAHH